MAVRIGDEAPNFTADTTEGEIEFHDYVGDGWCVLFSHPKDFTPVCTTELGSVARLMPEFQQRNCKVMGLSVDSVDDHNAWKKDIEETQGAAVSYPLVGDTEMTVAKLYDMLHPNASGAARARTAADNATVRSVFIVGPDKKVKATLTYPMSSGRNFNEILRLIDSCQLTARIRWRPRPTGRAARNASSCRRCRTMRRRKNTRTDGARRSRICATCRSRKSVRPCLFRSGCLRWPDFSSCLRPPMIAGMRRS